MIPGSNLLNMALRTISAQGFTYVPWASRAIGANGMYINTYGDSQQLAGSVQPVPRRLYEQYGLDFQKSYYNVFVSANVMDLQRDVAGDKIVYNGQNFQVESRTPWFAADGWNELLCVLIP